MTHEQAVSAKPRARLSEDWLAAIAGVLIALIVASGVLGSGGQTLTFTVEHGTSVTKSTTPSSGWQVSAILDDARLASAHLPNRLEARKHYHIRCIDGVLSVQVDQTSADQAQVEVSNDCGTPLRLTYISAPIVPYPMFKLF
ncbi:MAG: hypothetical protein OHK0023_08810 [Anaerolineae bacterium]